MTHLRSSAATALLAAPAVPVLRPDARRAHLVGIGGSGMKALAELLIGLGWQVSGSDAQPSGPVLQLMKRRGLRIHAGHHDRFLPRDADVLIHSPAVGPANPERRMAARLGMPVLSYSQVLGWLMESRVGVAIAGTHGKSTTTAMTARILTDAGRDPCAVVGAEPCGRGTAGRAGQGELFVVESCEYERSFLDVRPRFAAILAIEPDHFDCYATFAETCGAFGEFAARVEPGGVLIVRAECPAASDAARNTPASVVTFSCRPRADWWAADVRAGQHATRFRVFRHGEFFTEISLTLCGEHNVLNALAAVAVCGEIGVSPADIRESLAEFAGVRRRFETVGSYRGITLIDDYAHHPTAVRTTLQAARQKFGRRRIWCLFQPHQVSRTVALFDEFAESFHFADEVLVAPVYAARESVGGEAETIAEQLAERIAHCGPPSRFSAGLDRIIATLDDEARPGDVVITMGAGDINRVHHELTRRLWRHHAAERAAGPVPLAESGRSG